MALTDAISMENDVFRAYAFWSAVIVVKMLFMSLWTAKARISNKVINVMMFLQNIRAKVEMNLQTFANPEDAASMKVKTKFGDDDVERVRR